MSHKSYRIVTQPEDADSSIVTPMEIDDELEELFIKARKGKASVKGRLEKLIRRYPKLPFLRNYLLNWYIANKQHDSADRVNEEMLSLFPDYIFAVVYKAGKMLERNDLDSVEQLLAGRLDIESFYPDRKSFHLSEFRACVSLAVSYLLAKDMIEAAEERITWLEEVEIDAGYIEVLRLSVERAKIRITTARVQQYYEAEIDAIGRVDCTLPQKEILMEPTAEQFEFLFKKQWDIDADQLRNSIQHHKEALIGELHHIVKSAIEGYKYMVAYSEMIGEWPPTVLHALLILPYIDAEAGIGPLLAMLRQPDECCNFWIGDWGSEVAARCFKDFSEFKLQQILDFVLEHESNHGSKNIVLELLPGFVLDQPESRDKIIKFLNTVFEYFIANKDDETIFDSTVLAFAIGAAIDIKAVELMEVIEFLYENNWVSISVEGDVDDVRKRMMSTESTIRFSLFDDVYVHLRQLRDTIEEIAKNRILYDDADDAFTLDDEEDDYDVIERETPINRNGFHSVSKNAPCPCGSGKKYKRCHGQ